MKTIDKLKRLRDELKEKIDNELLPSYANALAIDVVSSLDAIIEAEEKPDEAGKTANKILSKHLKACYETHLVQLPDKYHGYILRAMEEYLNQSKQIKALHQIENLMERWHHARDNDNETLQKINDELVGIGLLKWFNKDAPPNTEKRDQFGVKAESKDI